jgi:fructokinase
MSNGEPAYQIAPDSASDYLLPEPSLEELAANCHAVCYGSLAERAAVSMKTIRDFLQAASQSVRLYDANLRWNPVTGEQGYTAEIVETSCRFATVIKVNSSEVVTICDLLRIGSASTERSIDELLKRFPARAVVLTRGEQGTQLFTRHGVVTAEVPPVDPQQVFPVGAGDACSAGLLVGFTLGWPDRRAVDLANRMGAWVASRLSATPPLPASILNFIREEELSRCSI